MRKRRRQRIISTRLSDEDQERFENLCFFEGIKRSELARKAILEYIDKPVTQETLKQQNTSEQQIKKLGERLAKMIARAQIDIGILNQVIFDRADPNTREALWEKSRTTSVARLTKKRKRGDKEASEVANDALGGEA